MLPEQNTAGLVVHLLLGFVWLSFFLLPLKLYTEFEDFLGLGCFIFFPWQIIIKQNFFLLMSFACISAICCLGSPSQGQWRHDVMVPSGLQSSETGVAGFCLAARAGQTYGPNSTAASSCYTAAGQHTLAFLGILIYAIYCDNFPLSGSNLLHKVCIKIGIAVISATILV